MGRERNYLPLSIVTSRFKNILKLLVSRPTDSAEQAQLRAEVYYRFRDWLINLVMPYFYENGLEGKLNGTEEERTLHSKLTWLLCGVLQNLVYCYPNQTSMGSMKSKEPLSDEDYCDEMLPKIVHQYDVTVDVALDVLERCPDQVLASPNKEEFMSKLTSKVETKEEMERLKKWEKKRRSLKSQVSRLKTQNGLKWAEKSIRKANIRVEAREKCRDMVFQTLRKVFA